MVRLVPSARSNAVLLLAGGVPFQPLSEPLLVPVAASGASDELPVKPKRVVWVSSDGLVVFVMVIEPQFSSGIACGVIQSFGSEVMLVDERLCMNTEPKDAHG